MFKTQRPNLNFSLTESPKITGETQATFFSHSSNTSTSNRKIRILFRRGLTLLELMMVLVILAIVSTIALASLQPKVQQQRFDSSSHLLSNVNEAVVGPVGKYQLDKTPLISGFVADVGRLPMTSLSSLQDGAEDPLSELYSVNSGVANDYPFQVRSGPKTPLDFSLIRIPCGWRGPYLNSLGIGEGVKDPWGRFLQATTNSRQEVLSVAIPLPGISDDQQSSELIVKNQPFKQLSQSLVQSLVTVTGRIVTDNPAAKIDAYLLLPDPRVSLSGLAVRKNEESTPGVFAFSEVPVGLRAVVVVVGGKQHVKYLWVTHQGADVTFDLRNNL